jgi:nucleoside-diphosphate-sugar epimerase
VRILVTGANGFLGAACLREIHNRRMAEVRLLTARGSLRRSLATPLEGVEYTVVGDIDGATDWKTALDGVQVVIHTAGLAHRLDERDAATREEYRLVNLTGTQRLASHAASSGVQRLIFVSSVGVNGATSPPGGAFSESDTPQPQNAYARSKWEAEQELMRVASTGRLEIVIVRPPLIYGPDAPGNFGTLVRAVRRGRPLPLGAVHNQRSFVGLDNLVDFLLTCATDVRAVNQTFMVSDGRDLSTTEFIRTMAHAGDVALRLLPIPAWVLAAAATVAGKADVVRRLCCDLKINIAKAHAVLGWIAPLTIEEGLRRAMLAQALDVGPTKT